MRRRLLVVTPRFPFPPYGGDLLRIYRMCEVLKSEWSITLVSICQSRRELEQALPDDSPFSEVHRVKLALWRSYVQVCWAAISGRSLQVAYYDSAQVARLIETLSEKHDAILCHLVRTASYVGRFVGPRVLDLTDHMPLVYVRSNGLNTPHNSLLRRLIYRMECDRADRAQNRAASDFDLITLISNVDRDLFLESSGADPQRVTVVSNGVSIPGGVVNTKAAHKVVFVGNMTAAPNIDAVMYFVETILPTVMVRYPGTRFRIIGRYSDALGKKLQRYPFVELVGPVLELNAAMADCAVGVCPVRIGAGVQNKMLDYMSHGVPAVTTSIGAEGLECVAGEHFLVADSPEQYASAVCLLLGDAELRGRIARAARTRVELLYSWESRMSVLRHNLSSLASVRAVADARARRRAVGETTV